MVGTVQRGIMPRTRLEYPHARQSVCDKTSIRLRRDLQGPQIVQTNSTTGSVIWTMRPMRAFLITAFLCAVSAKAEGQSQAGDDPVLRRVFTNWKAHQERIRSFYFRWNEKITLLKGSIDDFRPAVPRQLRRHSEEETYYSPNVEIWVDGEDRVRQDGHAWFKTSDAKSWAQAPLVFRRTCDGRIRSEYDRFPPCLSLDPAPRAWTRGWIETVNSKEIPEAALVLVLRSLRPPSAWSPDQCRVVTENAVFEGGALRRARAARAESADRPNPVDPLLGRSAPQRPDDRLGRMARGLQLADVVRIDRLRQRHAIRLASREMETAIHRSAEPHD
jgi:hypothetical protein